MRMPLVTENAHLDPRSVPGKWIQVEKAANGASLFGYIDGRRLGPNQRRRELSPRPRRGMDPRPSAGRAQRRTGFYYVFGALLLAAPWWWKYRAARFSLVFMTVAWLLMALTHDAGTSAHHVILLWPFPILFAAVALASLPWRPLAWTAAARHDRDEPAGGEPVRRTVRARRRGRLLYRCAVSAFRQPG